MGNEKSPAVRRPAGQDRPRIPLRKNLVQRTIDGNVGHSSSHGSGPHDIWVCVLPEDNRENWNEITKEAAWALHHAA
jgi:hypothetical protein